MELAGSHINKMFQTMMFTKNRSHVYIYYEFVIFFYNNFFFKYLKYLDIKLWYFCKKPRISIHSNLVTDQVRESKYASVLGIIRKMGLSSLFAKFFGIVDDFLKF